MAWLSDASYMQGPMDLTKGSEDLIQMDAILLVKYLGMEAWSYVQSNDNAFQVLGTLFNW